MKALLIRLSRKLAASFKKALGENESGCGRCGVCRHMCGLLKMKKSARLEDN